MKLNNGDWFCKFDMVDNSWIILEANDYVEAYGYKIEDKNIITPISFQPYSIDSENKDYYMLHNMEGYARNLLYDDIENKKYYIHGILHTKREFNIKLRKEKFKILVNDI